MSIADKIMQLEEARNDIRAAIEAKGIPAGGKNFGDFAGLILKLGGTIATTDLVDKRGEGETLYHKLSQNVTVSNGETPSFALASGQSLPSGVTLATDGILQGQLTVAGVFDVRVAVTAAGCASATLRVVITVVEAGVITVSDQVVTGTTGENVSHQLVASASNGEELEFLPYVGNDCPANLTCSSSGLITGIPAEAKTTKVQFYVRAVGCPDKLFFVDFKISAASDGFPKSFNVTSVPVASGYVKQPLGSYARTGETLELGGVAYPVYSYTSIPETGDQKTFYIHICNQMMGSTGVYWALSYEKPTSAETEGYTHPRLGCVELKSGTYEPQGKDWGGADGGCTVEWTM